MTRNQIQYAQLLEDTRAHKAQESIARTRDQLAHELGVQQLAETSRSNLAREGETSLHNRVTEASTAAKYASDVLESERKLAEQKRSNQAREVETTRHNLAWESILASKNPSILTQVTVGNPEFPEGRETGSDVPLVRTPETDDPQNKRVGVKDAKTQKVTLGPESKETGTGMEGESGIVPSDQETPGWRVSGGIKRQR